MGIRMAGHALGACQTKVSQLQFATIADEQILRLDIAMQDTPLVAVGETAQELEEEQTHIAMIQSARMLFHILR